MRAISPVFRFESQTNLHAMEGRRIAEFQIEDEHDTVLYKPLDIVFSLEYDDTLEYITIVDLRARLIRGCGTIALPPLHELRALALEAIQVFTMFSNACMSRSPPPPAILWLQPEPSDNSYGLPF